MWREQARGRPRRRWMKGCLNVRGLTIQEAKECVKDRREWRRLVGSDVDNPEKSKLHEAVYNFTMRKILSASLWKLTHLRLKEKSVVWVKPMLLLCVLGDPKFLVKHPYRWKKRLKCCVSRAYAVWPHIFEKSTYCWKNVDTKSWRSFQVTTFSSNKGRFFLNDHKSAMKIMIAFWTIWKLLKNLSFSLKIMFKRIQKDTTIFARY